MNERFELRRVTDAEWLILDHRFAANDPQRTLACISPRDDATVEVMWMREIGAPKSYGSPFDALEHARKRLDRRDAPLAGASPSPPQLVVL